MTDSKNTVKVTATDTVFGVPREPKTKKGRQPLKAGGSLINSPKVFRTFEEQVAILASRNVGVDENTPIALMREGYYSIVNGYKTPYLDKQAMQNSSEDVYKQGVRFDWIYDLFKFDRELRMLTFSYLSNAEAIFRTAIEYAFSQNHRDENSYLNSTNFCKPNEYLVPTKFRGNVQELHARNFPKLMKALSEKLVVGKYTRGYVKHYQTKYGSTPLWVLGNDLTFGNLVHFYQMMQPQDRNNVCGIIARVCERDSKAEGYLSPRTLLRSVKVLNEFRNLCAHDERLYCAKIGNDGYATMFQLLRNVIPHEEYQSFTDELVGLFNRYYSLLHCVSLNELMDEMGFPKEVRQ